MLLLLLLLLLLLVKLTGGCSLVRIVWLIVFKKCGLVCVNDDEFTDDWFIFILDADDDDDDELEDDDDDDDDDDGDVVDDDIDDELEFEVDNVNILLNWALFVLSLPLPFASVFCNWSRNSTSDSFKPFSFKNWSISKYSNLGPNFSPWNASFLSQIFEPSKAFPYILDELSFSLFNILFDFTIIIS